MSVLSVWILVFLSFWQSYMTGFCSLSVRQSYQSDGCLLVCMSVLSVCFFSLSVWESYLCECMSTCLFFSPCLSVSLSCLICFSLSVCWSYLLPVWIFVPCLSANIICLIFLPLVSLLVWISVSLPFHKFHLRINFYLYLSQSYLSNFLSPCLFTSLISLIFVCLFVS